ncbi:uracil-DNA glycosylase, putative [Bodo saltans]|uniref:NAD(P)(+)--arginine ADP-ribosyltransferase n=1 Tax=Bodo saltans TaxID=75058 RepID=A0A0S4IJ01_BODSA|nr:uracil-DNA glycosylase, putative [Bodo saltans]|eukprot:CUE73840.1 uracil-DNA glycosylase, putative [Bodo saltans]
MVTKIAKRRDEKQAIIVLPVSENSIGFRMKACVTRRGLVGVADLKENDPAEASGEAQPQIVETKQTYSRDQSTLRLKWTGPFSNLQLDIRIIMIENEFTRDNASTSRPTQYKIEVRPLPMTRPRGQTTNPGQLGVTADKQRLKEIWHHFAMDVVHIAGLLDDLPHDIAPVERYDFRFTSCLHDSKKDEEAEHHYCTKPRCAFEHHRVLCLSDSRGGVGCEVFPRCNYVHGYSRLRVALSIAPTLLGPERYADGLTLSPRAGESKSARIAWQKVNRSITTKYGRQLMRIIDLLHKIAEGPPSSDAIQYATNAISALHFSCTRVRSASTLAQCKAILHTHVGQDQPKQQKHKDPCDVSDSARVRVTVNLLTSDPSTEETIQAKMDHNLVSAVALALNELLRPPTVQPIMSVAEFDERMAQLKLTMFAHREMEAPWKSSALRLLAELKKRDHHYRFSQDVDTCENTEVTDSENGKVNQVFDALANVDPLSKCVFDPLPVEAPCTQVVLVDAVRNAVDTLDKINVNKFDKTKIDFDSVMDDIHLTGDSNKAEVLRAAVQTYTGVSGLYAKVNAVLRMRHELTKNDLFSGITPYMAIVLRGLQCAPLVKRSLPIYRGVSLTRSQHCQFVQGVSVVWNTITSCTVDESSAVKFAVGNYAPKNPIIGETHPVTFVIESATCVDVHHMSQSKHEQEVILLPGTRLKVTKVTLEQVWFTQVC